MSEYKLKTLDEVGLSNDFMFGKVMQNKYLCKKLLQLIFPEINIEHIEYPELQKSIKPDGDAHGIRLDVYVKDDKNSVYDIEMQAVDTKELPKRSRYYQGVIDLQLIDAGQSYSKLGHNYVIFICLEDIFGKGRHQYRFENFCTDDKKLALGDETVKIFLNADGTMDDVSDDMKKFLEYIGGKMSDNLYVQELEAAVVEARKNKEWRHEFMTLEMRDRENLERGRSEGRIAGHEEARNEMIRNALNKGTSVDTLVELFGFSPEEILAVKEKIKKDSEEEI